MKDILRTTEEIPTITYDAVQVALTRMGPKGLEVFLGLRSAKVFFNQWGLPGGKRDTGETDEQAACREAKEEMGVELPEQDLIYFRDTESSITRLLNGIETRYNYRIKVYIVDAKDLSPHNTSPNEHFEMKWMTIQEALDTHDRAVVCQQLTGLSCATDKIPGALAPQTLETIQLLAWRE